MTSEEKKIWTTTRRARRATSETREKHWGLEYDEIVLQKVRCLPISLAIATRTLWHAIERTNAIVATVWAAVYACAHVCVHVRGMYDSKHATHYFCAMTRTQIQRRALYTQIQSPTHTHTRTIANIDIWFNRYSTVHGHITNDAFALYTQRIRGNCCQRRDDIFTFFPLRISHWFLVLVWWGHSQERRSFRSETLFQTNWKYLFSACCCPFLSLRTISLRWFQFSLRFSC